MRSRGRYLAPIALVGVIAGVALVVRGELHTSSPGPATPAVSGTTTANSATTPASPTFYIVKPGDSLSTIAVKTGISVGTIEALNPSVNPNVLQTGQRLRLRQ
jgi:LysM repeat protein